MTTEMEAVWRQNALGRVRQAWLFIRRILIALVGADRLHRVLWACKFYHLKSRWSRRQVTLPNHLSAYVRPQDQNIYQEIFSREIYNPCRIAKNSTIIDCGSHIGLFTLSLANECPEGRIIALEPSPLNLEMLRLNVRINDLDNVTILPYGVSDESKEGTIHFTGEYGNDYCATPVIGPPSSVVIPIRLIRIDEVFERQNLTRCDVLKIDVEGSELDALRGAQKTLAKTDQVLLEIHKLAVRLEEVTSLLKRAGFRFKLYGETYHIQLLYAWKQSPGST